MAPAFLFVSKTKLQSHFPLALFSNWFIFFQSYHWLPLEFTCKSPQKYISLLCCSVTQLPTLYGNACVGRSLSCILYKFRNKIKAHILYIYYIYLFYTSEILFLGNCMAQILRLLQNNLHIHIGFPKHHCLGINLSLFMENLLGQTIKMEGLAAQKVLDTP